MDQIPASIARRAPSTVWTCPSTLYPAFADSSFRLEWEPEEARVEASGKLGWTWGRYNSRSIGADGVEKVGRGKFLTVWRRNAEGVWKVEADIGNDEPGGE